MHMNAILHKGLIQGVDWVYISGADLGGGGGFIGYLVTPLGLRGMKCRQKEMKICHR